MIEIGASPLEPHNSTGPPSNTLAGADLVEKLTDFLCLNIRDRSTHTELDRLLQRRLP